jgi:SAM-dependent methyltransferase
MTLSPTAAQAPVPAQGPSAGATALDSLENRYYSFLRGQGYSSSETLQQVLAVYLPYFRGFPHVADLGCGHGEFLALLRAQGNRPSGVDVDPGMVAAAQAAGFDVTLGDAVEWLAARPQALDAVFSSNVVEHLPPEQVSAWLHAAWQALRPGGLLLFATPNPESAIVHLYEFWRDPTHVRLYNRQLLEFMLVDAGFTGVQSHLNPAAAWEGADVMLAGVEEPLPTLTLPDLPARVPELPAQLDASFPAHKRLLWRLLRPLYRVLSAPFVEPVRYTVELHSRSLEQTRAALEQTQAQAAHVAQRLQRLAAAERFLYPAREYYVLGYKPAGPDGAQQASHPGTIRLPETQAQEPEAQAPTDAAPPPAQPSTITAAGAA